MKGGKWWWGIGAVLLLCSAVVGIRSCRVEDKYSKLKGAYEEYRRIVEADMQLAAEKLAAQNAVIADLDKKILTSEQVLQNLQQLTAQKDADLTALRESWAGLSLECQASLHALDTKWSEKFTLLEGVVAEKDKQLAAWALKYAAAVTIGETWKAQYEAEHRLRRAGETLNKVLEGKYRRARVTSSVKNVALVVLAGVATYQLVRGK